jgi:hypothetical protein
MQVKDSRQLLGDNSVEQCEEEPKGISLGSHAFHQLFRSPKEKLLLP